MLFRDDITLPFFRRGKKAATATKREQIFSVTLLSLWVCIGILISGAMEHGENADNLEYHQAVKISNDPVEFRESMQTDVGNAFVDGKFITLDPVTYPYLSGAWLSIHAEHQSYERHTRVETYTDSHGRSRSRTETYWTWDTYKVVDVHAERVNFLDQIFNYDTFDFDRVGTTESIADTGYHKRIRFSAVPATFDGAIYAVLKDSTISNRNKQKKVAVYENKTADTLLEHHLVHYGTVVFWIFWILFGLVLLYVFNVIENKWLENEPPAI